MVTYETVILCLKNSVVDLSH